MIERKRLKKQSLTQRIVFELYNFHSAVCLLHLKSKNIFKLELSLNVINTPAILL